MLDQVIQFSVPETWFRFETLSYQAPYQTMMHQHRAWQLTASLDGEFRFRTKGKSIFIGPGEWVLMSPGFLHDAGSDSAHSSAIQLFFRRFPKSLMPEFAAAYNLRRDMMQKGHLPLDELCRLTAPLNQKVRTSEPDSRNVLLALQFILTLLSPIPEMSGEGQGEMHPRIIKAVEYMEEHFAEPVAVADMAAAVSLSENRFAVLFKEQIGYTPMQFLNSLRLDHAQSLLLRGESIADAAALSGFSSNQYFCRYFHKMTGQTPGEFRKMPFHHEKKSDNDSVRKRSACCTGSTCI